ncbi:relaxase/mobilization nuclease domain-containing protein [Marivita sp. GX14005]|uniref:relaxase/mobilization nuclease domain-containing protein n=1 Tax=Marivita sp. GX14005 TaxID=2942276 RepID=UPI0020191713|nr:relaxase/mobilization nuclease domain-containing protein [Marivita sp. GX14005]MCL3883893.1 relaxase/mobilization nuclease domain-containing protein [Marivita sp. GX14005]
MIGEVIKKEGEKGSGGGADAFRPGVTYVCSKAVRVALRNIASSGWQDAAEEMRLTSELNSRVRKPYYHLVLSWHELEQPTDDQMVEAADHMIRSLGLKEHQVVIGTHHDTKRRHIHLVCNTVHPTTGKVWSKSNDHLRIEKACREIELAQGWSHDRGRFEFDVSADGTVALRPNPAAWDRKKADRGAGKRPKTSGARKFEKSAGIETFEHGVPAALKARFEEAVGSARDWQGLHAALGALGLRYYRAGSGARIGLLGSEEFAKASAFGSKYSIRKMEAVLGAYEDPGSAYVNDLKEDHKDIESISGMVWDEDQKATASSAFKLTLLRRIYCDLHLDAAVSEAIRFVDLQDVPPQITFRDNATLVDHGDRLSTSRSTRQTRTAMIAIAKAKGWSSVKPTGSPDFVRLVSLEAARAGLAVHGVPEDIQAQCDAILERLERQQRRIETEARAGNQAAHEAVADRDQAIRGNDAERAEAAARIDVGTAEARAVIKAIGSGRDPVRTALRTVARAEEKRIKAELPDRRTVSTPQSAPDADRRGGSADRRIARAIHENDHHELDRMRTVHIDEIAVRCGWSCDPKHKDGHNDPKGRDRRTYVRGAETIKATRKGPVWVWTNNKTGASGSVIDLWLLDNPGSTLGDARKAFREIMGIDAPAPVPAAAPRRSETPQDHTEARRRWEEAPYIEDRRTYAQARGISTSTLHRFRDDVRCGVFGGIYFAHRNPETGDIQGFEQRWEKDGRKNTARFARGGLKTVAVLGNPETATRMVIFEGGLDALALAELEAREDTIYVSTGGGFGARTAVALLKLAEGRQVMSGFDNDAAGAALHKRLATLLPGATRLAPPSQVGGAKKPCKDWLDVLNASREAPSPAMSSSSLAAESKQAGLAEKSMHDPHLDEPEMPGCG